MQRQIYAYRCNGCGTLHYPFRMVCRSCRANDYFEFTPEPLPTRGRLLTYTHVHNLPAEYEVARLGLGIVELENGMRILGQLDVEAPELGMEVDGEVAVVRREAYDERYGIIFRAA
jgi:uncharacterized OB-fold protein